MPSFPLPPTKPELITPGRFAEQSRRIDISQRPVLQKPRIYDTYVGTGTSVSGVGQTQAGVDIYWEPGDQVGVMLTFNALSNNGATAMIAYLGGPDTGLPHFPNAWQGVGGTGSLPTTATGLRLVYNTTHAPALVNATDRASGWGHGFLFSQQFSGATIPAAGMRRISFHVARLSGTGTIMLGAIRMKVIVV